MPYEVEQKYLVADLERLQGKLLAMGGIEAPTVEQYDTYFNHPARDFATTDEAFRIRRVGEQNYLTYKGPKLDAETKTREEHEVRMADGAETIASSETLFTQLGFRRVTTVHKRRIPWSMRWHDCRMEVVLDQVERVGDYAEIELVVSSAAEIPTAQQRVAELANALELHETERLSYLELLLAAQ